MHIIWYVCTPHTIESHGIKSQARTYSCIHTIRSTCMQLHTYMYMYSYTYTRNLICITTYIRNLLRVDRGLFFRKASWNAINKFVWETHGTHLKWNIVDRLSSQYGLHFDVVETCLRCDAAPLLNQDKYTRMCLCIVYSSMFFFMLMHPQSEK